MSLWTKRPKEPSGQEFELNHSPVGPSRVSNFVPHGPTRRPKVDVVQAPTQNLKRKDCFRVNDDDYDLVPDVKLFTFRRDPSESSVVTKDKLKWVHSNHVCRGFWGH